MTERIHARNSHHQPIEVTVYLDYEDGAVVKLAKPGGKKVFMRVHLSREMRGRLIEALSGAERLEAT